MAMPMADLEDVRVELERVDASAYALYKTCKESKLRGFTDDLKLLLTSLDEVVRQTTSSRFLRSEDGEPSRAKLLWLLRDCDGTLLKLEEHLRRVFGPRNQPPPPLGETREIQEELVRRGKALLKWNLDLVNEPEVRSPKALPPSSPPSQPKKKPTPPPTSSGERSPAIPTVKPSHRRAASYAAGGVPLPKPVIITANLKPPQPDRSTRSTDSAKAPPSPYQPTVEEIPDEGSPDEDKSMYVEEYHFTPPESPGELPQAASSSKAPAASKDSEKGAARPSTEKQSSSESIPKIVQPDLTQKTSYNKDNAFLSPNDAVRRPPEGVPEDSWQRPQEDFQLWDSTDEEEAMGMQTPFRVESISAQNTPRDNIPPPSPRPHRSSFTRSPYPGDARSTKQSPRYSPGHSPWVNSQQYPNDGRFRGKDGKEKFSPNPSPQEPSKEFLGRPRANTTQGAPYPTDTPPFGPIGGSSAFHFQSTHADFGGTAFPDAKEFLSQFVPGGAKDDWENPFRIDNKEHERDSAGPSRDERPSRDTSGSRKEEAKVKEITTLVPLEEIFTGTTRKMKVTDRESKSSKVLDLPIKPGLKAGSKIKFSSVGFGVDRVIGDIHFIVQEKPHPTFTRQGDDLHATVDIDLYESLCGWERYITSICGKNVRIRSSNPTGPSWKECYAGLGMPKSKKPSERGDLWVGVNVVYPAALSEEKRRALREILRP